MTLSTPEKVQSLYLGAGRLAIRAVETTSPPPATDNPEALRADRDRHDAILRRISAGRWGVPTSLAGSAVFLATRASDYVHGHSSPSTGVG